MYALLIKDMSKEKIEDKHSGKNFIGGYLSMGIRIRFLLIFSIALGIGLLYGFTAVGINICISEDILFSMSVDVAEMLLVELVGYVVIIYGFFAAFLIYTIGNIPKFSDEKYNSYKKVISEKMNIFVLITGFIVAFLFFFLWSIYWLEFLRGKGYISTNLPALAPAYIIFFMLIISLLGYLVFSLVIGLLHVRAEKT